MQVRTRMGLNSLHLLMRTPMPLLLCLIFFACDFRPPSTDKPADTQSIISRTTSGVPIEPTISEAFWDSLYADCQTEFERRDQLFLEAGHLFKSSIVITASSNHLISEANRVFLSMLGDFVWEPRSEERFLNPIFEQLLIPIFHHEPDHIGLHGNERVRQRPDGKLFDITFEGRLQRMHDLVLDPQSEVMLDTLFLLPHIFEQEIGSRAKSVYVFTDSRRTIERPINFGYRYAACYHYHLYPISTESLTSADKVLFASTIPLDLVFERRHDIEHILRKMAIPWCSDCSQEDPPEIAFASVQGVEQLVFTYSDTFPYNNQYDNPMRSLVLKVNDSTVVRLWSEDIDLSGCPCL